MMQNTLVTIKFMVGYVGKGPDSLPLCQMWMSVSWARTTARRASHARTPRAPSTARHGAVWRAFSRTPRATVWVSGVESALAWVSFQRVVGWGL